MLEKRDKTEVENLLHAQALLGNAESLRQFNNDPDKLPSDHHELIAMIAPRAVLMIESTLIPRMERKPLVWMHWLRAKFGRLSVFRTEWA